MKILVSGGTGLLGGALTKTLEDRGDEVTILSRSAGPNRIAWDASSPFGTGHLKDVDAVIHLAGESIAGTRWNEQKKRAILDSRTKSTQFLAEALAAQASDRKRTFISASAIGLYGDRGEEKLTESSERGQGFLADVCEAWEAAAEPARAAGLRVVHPRIGVVLAKEGGALAAMLTPFKLGAGGVIGSGQQYMPWIAIEDVVGLLLHCLDQPDLHGPINLTAPHPETNRVFTKALGRALSRPTFLPLPAFAARLALGEMADALLLSSARVLPQVALDTGYQFQAPQLEPYLQNLFRNT